MSPRHRRGLTITEVLVLTGLAVILVGSTLPMLGSAGCNDDAARSRARLRRFAVVHAAYAADWNGRQMTLVVDELSTFGNAPTPAIANYAAVTGTPHPSIVLGTCDGEPYEFSMSFAGNHELVQPIDFSSGFGWFRMPNVKPLHDYFDGRFYSEVYYAPADGVLLDQVEPFFDDPCEFVPTAELPVWSSYCLSPSALFSPDVLAIDENTLVDWRDPWDLDDGFTSPPLDAARHASLKTHMMEHNWLQTQDGGSCNPEFVGEACEPYYFNQGFRSNPMTLFYDGHVRGLSVTEVRRADRMVQNQSSFGLWSRDTPFGETGYFMDLSFDNLTGPGFGTSYHVLTTDGILGRDTLD